MLDNQTNFGYALCPNQINASELLSKCPCLFIRRVCLITNGNPFSTSLFGVLQATCGIFAFITIIVRVLVKRKEAERHARNGRSHSFRLNEDHQNAVFRLSTTRRVEAAKASEGLNENRTPFVPILPMHFAYMCYTAAVVIAFTIVILFVPSGRVGEGLEPVFLFLVFLCQILPVIFLLQKSWGFRALKNTLKIAMPCTLILIGAATPVIIVYEMRSERISNDSDSVRKLTTTYLGLQPSNVGLAVYHLLTILVHGFIALIPAIRRRFDAVEKLWIFRVTHRSRTSSVPLASFVCIVNLPFFIGSLLILLEKDSGVCVWQSSLILYLLTFPIALNESLKADTEFIRKLSTDPKAFLLRSPRSHSAGAGRKKRGARGLANQDESPVSPLLRRTLTEHLSVPSIDSFSRFIFDFSQISIEREISSGAVGRVYAGWLGGFRVALKKLHMEIFDESTMADALVEAMILSSLRHENIVEFKGICFQPPYFYMITSLCEDNVHMRLNKDALQLSYSDGLKWTKEIARAMAYLHSLSPPVLHRDLKTPNLLASTNPHGPYLPIFAVDPLSVTQVDFDGRLRVCDFDTSTSLACFPKGRKGKMLGTIQWAAPEAMDNLEVATTASDVYSFGVIVNEIFTSILSDTYSPPFSKFRGFLSVIEDQVKGGYRPDPPSELPQALKDLIRKCWSPLPGDRPSFSEICITLEALT
mmetsp:Transcript_906/g.1812  ORF Transcript_906/g.1812 Transcript_906/m.1812 type:complete len:701 (+) Transcript_906:165-2267(+)